MIKKIIYGILLSILVASCQQKRQESEVSPYKPYTIDLSEVEYSEEPQLLSDFVESIEYIKFSEEPLVPYLTCLAEDNKGNIYLDTPNDIYKYTPTGAYVKSLFKKGQGPGEVANKLSGSVFNIDGDYVLVRDYGKSDYCKFTLDGTFMGMEHHHEGMVSKTIFAFWKNTELYSYVRNAPYERYSEINRDSLFFFTVRDLATGSVILKLRNYHFDVKGKVIGPYAVSPCAPAYRGVINDSLLWVKPSNVDTVFCTTDWKDLRPLYIIKQPKKAADYAWMTISEAGSGNYSANEYLNKMRLMGVWALGNGLLYSYYQNMEQGGAGFCPADGKGKTFSKLFKNDVDKYCPSLDLYGPIYQGEFFQKNGYLYLLVDAFKFFEEGARPPFADLTEESNPVLVKLKLK
jgi:lipoprotein